MTQRLLDVTQRLRLELMLRLRPLMTPGRAAVLALLLLAAQALGLAHRIAHGPALPASAPASVAMAQPSGDIWGHTSAGLTQIHAHAPDWYHLGYDQGHDDSHEHGPGSAAECRLYDQLLGHADVLLASVVPPTLPTPAVRQWAGVAQVISRAAAAPYQARAPPQA